jgi:hypothetical protein
MSAGKIVLIVVAVIVVGIAAAIGGGYWWVQKNAPRLQEEGKAAMKEGAHFGSGKPITACLDEALRRLTPETGIMDEAKNKQFFSACMKVADMTPDFCVGVPPRGEIMQTATWAVAKCNELGRNDKECTRLVGAIQERCLKQPS